MIWLLIFVASFGSYINILNYQYALLRSLANIIPLIILFYFNSALVTRYFEKKEFKKFYARVFVLALIIISIRIFVNIQLQYVFTHSDFSSSSGIFISLAIITSLGTIFLSSVFTLLQNKIQSERLYLQEINDLKTNQLKYLKSQVNPHFLFNSLNNIYSLVLTKSENAPEMLLKLSDLLRYSLYTSEKTAIPLSEEISQIKKYISLNSLKSQSELNVELNYESSNQDTSIPPMMLITFVENAFKHGDIFSDPNGFLKIDILEEDEKFTFNCINSYSKKNSKDETSGIGLQNIKERLNILYKENYNLEIIDLGNSLEVKLELNFDR